MDWLRKLIPLIHTTLWFVWTFLLTLLVLNFIEALWIPAASHWTPTALLTLWSAHLTVSLAVLLATKRSWFQRSVTVGTIGASFWIISGWYWNEWSNAFPITPHRLTIDKVFFGQLAIANGVGVLISFWWFAKQTRRPGYAPDLLTPTRQRNFLLILLAGLLLAHFSSFLDLASNRSMKNLALATVFFLGGGTFYDVLRLSQGSRHSAWSGWRLISMFPAGLFSLIVFNQSPEFKTIPISMCLWFMVVYLSAPCWVGLAISLTDLRHGGEQMQPQSAKVANRRPGWLGAGISMALVVMLLISLSQFGGINRTFTHCRTEFDQTWRVTQMLKAFSNHQVEFNVDWERTGLRLRLPATVPFDILRFVHFRNWSRAGLGLTQVTPELDFAALPKRLSAISISNSVLSLEQIRKILARFERVTLKDVEILGSTSQAADLADRLPPISKSFYLDHCPRGTVAQLANVYGELSNVEDIILVDCRLDREDLSVIFKQAGKFKLYFNTEPFAEFLTQAAAVGPYAVPPGNPSLLIRVMGEQTWSPEEFPFLWTQIVDGVWSVDLPPSPPEQFFQAVFLSTSTLSNRSFSRKDLDSVKLAREKFVRENLALEDDEEIVSKSFKLDQSVVIGEAELKRLHWLFSSDLQSAPEAAKCDCLWLPNLTFLQHIDPKVLQKIRHLSFNRNWSRLFDNYGDPDRNHYLHLGTSDILTNLTQLESLDLATAGLFYGIQSIEPPAGLKRLTVDGTQHIPFTLGMAPKLEQLTVYQLPAANRLVSNPPMQTSVAITFIDRADVLSGHPNKTAASLNFPNAKFLPVRFLGEHRSELFEILRHQLRRHLRARIERAKQASDQLADH